MAKAWRAVLLTLFVDPAFSWLPPFMKPPPFAPPCAPYDVVE